MDDIKFTRALLRIPAKCILVLEDIDVLFNENRKKSEIYNSDIRFHWEIYRGKYLFNIGLSLLKILLG